MIQRKVVPPAQLAANGLWNHFTNRKRYTVTCGSCSHSYRDKVPFTVDTASSLCPCCGAQNTWSHSRWAASYERMLTEEKANG